MTLELSTHRDADVATVTAVGEIDLSTADALQHAITDVQGDRPIAVVVDLAGVTFIDSAGINVLLTGKRLADERGQDYRVTGAGGMVREVLELTGVWEHLSHPAG